MMRRMTIEKKEKFVINGAKSLKGEIEVAGSKNSALPLLAACCLFEEQVTLTNLPRIDDVFCMIEILESMGASVRWLDTRSICVDARNLNPERINQGLIQKLRASIVLVGPLLTRFKKFTIAHPGGCSIGARPLDTHFNAFKDLGVKISVSQGETCDIYTFDARAVHGGEVILEEFSVTATENILMFASLIKESIQIKLAGTEPHVDELIAFLRAAGVEIQKEDSHSIRVTGIKKLRQVRHSIINDYIEAGTFLILSIIAGGTVAIKNAPLQFLDAVRHKMRDMGVAVRQDRALTRVSVPEVLSAANIQTLPYPGFPTDLQAPFGLLLTQANGVSRIQEMLFEKRFGYLGELQKMGANINIINNHEAVIEGPTELRGASTIGFDLRAGISLILAGLIAKGETVIENAYHVDRGYERIDERLRALGADIKRV